MSETETETTGRAKRRLSTRTRVLFSLATIVVFLLLLVGIDRVLGGLIEPETSSLMFPSGSSVRHESCEFDVKVLISSAGLRDDDYAPGPPADGTVRIVTIGD